MKFLLFEIIKGWFTKKKEPKELLNKKSLDLIIKYEVGGGKTYYDKYLKKPIWPGASSGLTIGIGFDVGYNTKEQIKEAWEGILTNNQLKRLYHASGIKGSKAKKIVGVYSDINISYENALRVFKLTTIPRFYNLAKETFPCFEDLHPDAQGVLVSLVFNRGASLKGSTRKEMLALTQLTCLKRYKDMAKQIRGMKRLWVGKGLDGLLKRRDEEAKILESI